MKPLVEWLASLRYEQWLILVAVLLICLVASLTMANSSGLIDYDPIARIPISYAALCPRNPDGSLPVMQNDIKNGPRLRQVVAGLGTPDFVYHDNIPTISGEATFVEIGLDYPRLGVSVFAGYWVKGSSWNMQVRLDSALQVNFIFCYPPTESLKDTLRDVYHYDADMQMAKRMPWTGFGAWLP